METDGDKQNARWELGEHAGCEYEAIHEACFGEGREKLKKYQFEVLAMAGLDSWRADYLAIQRLAQSCQAEDTVAISTSPQFSLLL